MKVPFSLLMAVYNKDHPDHFEIAINSIVNQTVSISQLVLVANGILEPAHYQIIEQARTHFDDFVLIQLEKNIGLPMALNLGLEKCNQPYVARFDSDDFSCNNRFEKQYKFLVAYPEIDLLCCHNAEFSTDINKIDCYKVVPNSHTKIVKTLNWRNCISHPTIIVKRNLLNQIDGYKNYSLLEDYDLYLRLIGNGAKIGALEEPLVRVRATQKQFLRRGGYKHYISDCRFRFDSWKAGRMSLPGFLLGTILLMPYRLLPNQVRMWSYKLVRVKSDPAL